MMQESFDDDFEELPVVNFQKEIIDSICKNQIVICISETGSGKTTQIPQFCIDNSSVLSEYIGVDVSGKVVAVTQPRRVAAISVAHRVASERNVQVGGEVGYTVRFDDSSSSSTRIKYMTDGILVRECLKDPTLSKYFVVMLDEAHERSTNTDLLFGLLKSAIKLRPTLRVLVTSATMDAEKMSMYFEGCALLRIPGDLLLDTIHSYYI